MKEARNNNPLCGARTRSDNPCRKYPIAGKRRCRLHGGLSTGPKTAAGKARIAKAQLKHGKFVNWRERRKNKFVLEFKSCWLLLLFYQGYAWAHHHCLYDVDEAVLRSKSLEEVEHYIEFGKFPES